MTCSLAIAVGEELGSQIGGGGVVTDKEVEECKGYYGALGDTCLDRSGRRKVTIA